MTHITYLLDVNQRWVGALTVIFDKSINEILNIMKKLFPFIFLLIPMIASAHPGHGLSDGVSLGHYLVSGEHLFPIVLTIVLIFYIIKKLIPANK